MEIRELCNIFNNKTRLAAIKKLLTAKRNRVVSVDGLAGSTFVLISFLDTSSIGFVITSPFLSITTTSHDEVNVSFISDTSTTTFAKSMARTLHSSSHRATNATSNMGRLTHRARFSAPRCSTNGMAIPTFSAWSPILKHLPRKWLPRR